MLTPEWGNGILLARGRLGPGRAWPMVGDDLGSVQTFTINLNSSYTRTISGNIYYYDDRHPCCRRSLDTRLQRCAGGACAPVRSLPTKPSKVIPFTIKGLPAGAYYVRPMLIPRRLTPGVRQVGCLETQGFVHDNSIYKPAMLALVTTGQLTKCKLIMRDRDMDNDSCPMLGKWNTSAT